MPKSVDIAIVGNGIVALAVARELSKTNLSIAIIGPENRLDSASLAAAAMLNSFAELNQDSLIHDVQKYKFKKSQQAAKLWPSYLDELKKESSTTIHFIKTTTLVKTDQGSDRHFNAVEAYLKQFDEDYTSENSQRLTILNEHAVEPLKVVQALDLILSRKENVFCMNDSLKSLSVSEAEHELDLESGDTLKAKKVLIASGSQVSELRENISELSGLCQVFKGRGIGAHLRLPNHGVEGTLRTCHNGAHCGVYLIPHDKDRLYLGATSELMQTKEKRDQRMELNHLLERASQFLCERVKEASIEKVVLGYRPTTADAFPMMGKTSVENIWIASGTKRDGFHLAPVIAKEISESMINSTLAFEGKFNPERDLISCYSESDMLDRAVSYFQLNIDTITRRWEKIKSNYPHLTSGIEAELWPLFENEWVRKDIQIQN